MQGVYLADFSWCLCAVRIWQLKLQESSGRCGTTASRWMPDVDANRLNAAGWHLPESKVAERVTEGRTVSA